MAQLTPSLRKAAVLVSSLDDATADAILSQMSADDAAKVRSALVELSDIPPEEQQRVLADFLRQQEAAAHSREQTDVVLELNSASAEPAAPATQPLIAATPQGEEPLAFLEQVDPQAIALVLQHEHPQTAAVVVSHLPAHHAAAVLERLPASLATNALERIAALDAIAPDVMADLARGLRRQLAPHFPSSKAGAAALTHLTAVLQAMDFRQRQRVVLQLGQRNTALLKGLGLYPTAVTSDPEPSTIVAPRYRLDSLAVSAPQGVTSAQPPDERAADETWLTFDDLRHLSDAALRAVLAAADPELSLLALTGAEPRLIARILRRVPARDAAILRARLEHPGAVRLRDIEQARAALAAVANRLAHEGAIELPPSLRFAAAA